MPKVGVLEADIKFTAYIKNKGDAVKTGDPLFTFESDKITSEVESPVDGIVLNTYAEEGAVVPIGTLIMVVGEQGEDISEFNKELAAKQAKNDARPAPAASSGGLPVSKAPMISEESVKSSPAARKAAEQLGVSLAEISKKLGLTRRIQLEDVEAYVSSLEMNIGEATKETAEIGTGTSHDVTRIPVTHTRKTIADRMHGSLKNMAQTSISVELDVTELVDLRKKLLEKEKEYGVRITMTDLFSMSVVKMLKKHPLANAEWAETEIRTYPYVNLSVAVATEYGLVSPVIRHADQMTLFEFSRKLHEIVERARHNQLTAEDHARGTCTITNMGIYPVDGFNPIINPPQAAIIGFGRAVDKPTVFHGQITVRTMMTVSMTYDHRVFDGSEAGGMLADLKLYLEHPELIFI